MSWFIETLRHLQALKKLCEKVKMPAQLSSPSASILLFWAFPLLRKSQASAQHPPINGNGERTDWLTDAQPPNTDHMQGLACRRSSDRV